MAEMALKQSLVSEELVETHRVESEEDPADHSRKVHILLQMKFLLFGRTNNQGRMISDWSSYETTPNDFGGGNTIALEHNVECPVSTELTYWRLERAGSNLFIRFTCCKCPACVSEVPVSKPPIDAKRRLRSGNFEAGNKLR